MLLDNPRLDKVMGDIRTAKHYGGLPSKELVVRILKIIPYLITEIKKLREDNRLLKEQLENLTSTSD